MQLWYPGEEGGTALADVLFGDYNPAGRLPVTFYKSVDQLPPFEDYNMKGRTYRYFEGEPLFPFGYGLVIRNSVITIWSSPPRARPATPSIFPLRFRIPGHLQVMRLSSYTLRTFRQLLPFQSVPCKGFSRIHLDAGEKRTVGFTLMPKQLAVINADAKREVDAGDFEIAVGGIQPGTKSPTTEIVTQKMKIVGKPFVIE